MPSDQTRIERLTKKWEKADAVWKKAAKRSQEAVAAYRWTMQDDRPRWNRVLAKRMREAIAFKKAEAARENLVESVRAAAGAHGTQFAENAARP